MSFSNNRTLLTLFHLSLVVLVTSFELTLDREQDTLRWKFRGRYFYTESGEDLDSLVVPAESLYLLEPGVLSQPGVKGLWFAKHIPNRDNQLTISYRLTHQLFTQVWVSYLSHPDIPLLLKTNDGVLLGKFWSNGKSWCDAVVNVGLKTTVTLEVATEEPSHYFVLDKIILGIFGNITHLNQRELHSCSTARVPIRTEAQIPLSELQNPTTTSRSPLSLEDGESESQNPESFLSKETPDSNIVRKNKKSLREVSQKVFEAGDADESEVYEDGLRPKLSLETETINAQLIEHSTRTWINQKEGTRKTDPIPIVPSTKPRVDSGLNGTYLNDLDRELPPSDEAHTSTTVLHHPINGDNNMACECSCSCRKVI